MNPSQQVWIDDYNREEENDMKWSDSGGGDFQQPPVGTHVARCIKIIDIGTQRGEYQGKATIKRQCIIGWELPSELMTEGDYAGKPFTVSRFYTASLGEKANLRKDLANWRGRDFTKEELQGFEAKNILGKPCMLSLTTNEKGRVQVSGVMALPKAMQVPEQINQSVFFSLEWGEFNPILYDSLSDGIKKLIQVSPEYKNVTDPQNAPKKGGAFDDLEDDIPF